MAMLALTHTLRAAAATARARHVFTPKHQSQANSRRRCSHARASGCSKLCALAGLALQHEQRVALVLLRARGRVLDVAEVRRHHDLKLLRGDAEIGKVVLRVEQT